MCGFCGIVQWNGEPVGREVLTRMVQRIRYRGPDESRVEEPLPHVGLAHARLRVIDLSAAAQQPMASQDGALWLVYNGEIYNYRELRASLEQRGVRFRSASDTEVILKLYEADGARCVEQLDGMFAFAVWDGRRRSLFLARDRVGKKPLYYYAASGLFAFASEIKALCAHPAITPEIDADVLPAFFLHGYVPTPATFYRGIQSLPPGHWLQVEPDGTSRLESYWTLPSPTSAPAPVSEADARQRVRTLVTEAVERRLISDVPLGAFLSGGVDSSIVVGLMSRLTHEPVRTFSIGFAGDRHFDETSYARLVATRFGTVHTEFVVEPPTADFVERLVWHHDGPFGDSSAIPTYLLAQLTRQHVTVALNGDGGDEIFAGYLRFAAVLASERLPWWMRQALHGLLARLPAWGGHRTLFRRLQKFAAGATLPPAERLSHWSSVFYDDLPRLLPQWGSIHRSSELLSGLDASAASSPLGRLLRANVRTYLLDDLLVKMDRCSMAHGLETRSPFLDRALMEYVFELPDHLKLRGLQTKRILRAAFADLLPPAILRRGKMGFGVPLRLWFRNSLRDYLGDLLLAPDARLRSYVDPSYVRALYHAHLSGRADHSHRLWTLLTFEVWLRGLSRWSAVHEEATTLHG